MPVNETTIEARVDHLLKTVFPTFSRMEVIHQMSFTLKFGHHIITIDGKDPKRNYARAISDILLKVGDQNLILLELKKEGLKITADDIEQGLSYARLIHPMPPITLITNGKDHYFYDTYTKAKIDNPDTELASIQKRIDNAFKLALADKKAVIDTLLNCDPRIIIQIINQISAEKFEGLKGAVTDLTKPLSDEFSIPREVVEDIQYKLRDNTVVGLIGAAYSGKTNVLYQYFVKYHESTHGIFYLDCKDHNFSLFQQLSNNLSREFSFIVDPFQVRQWFLSARDNGQITILVDNLNNQIDPVLKNEIVEFIELFKGTNNKVLFSADMIGFQSVAVVENRNLKTAIGNIACTVTLKALSDSEFDGACEALFNCGKAVIQLGGQKTPEYRLPRSLRYVCSLYTDSKKEVLEGHGIMIPAIPDFEFVNAITQSLLFSSSIRDAFRKFAKAFLLDEENRKRDSHLNIAAHGSGAVKYDTAKTVLGTDIDILLSSGMVTLREFSSTGQVLFPKTPEVLTYYSIELVTEKVEQCSDPDQAYKVFLDCCTTLPYSDIVGAEVLNRLVTKGNMDLCSYFIDRLLDDSPQKETIGPGTKILSYTEDVGHMILNFPDGMDEGGFIGDFLPYVILSQFAVYPFLFGRNDEELSPLPYLRMVRQVGSNPTPMIRMYALPLSEMQALSTLTLSNYGEFVSGTEGIIEPIVQTLQRLFYHCPKLFDPLCKDAFKKKNMQLLWRIYLAVRMAVHSTDEEIVKRAKQFMTEFELAFSEMMDDVFTTGVEDEEKRAKMKELLRKGRETRGPFT